MDHVTTLINIKFNLVIKNIIQPVAFPIFPTVSNTNTTRKHILEMFK